MNNVHLASRSEVGAKALGRLHLMTKLPPLTLWRGSPPNRRRCWWRALKTVTSRPTPPSRSTSPGPAPRL
eukprot:786621-Prorocentrum_minimum.AAC.1